MNRLATKLRHATSAKLACALAAYFACAAGEIQAGCGDHVVVLANLSPEQRAVVVRMMIGRSCGQAVHGEAVRGDTAPACSQCPFAPLSDGPCRGPYCSNERQPDGAPVSPAPSRTIDPWSLLVHVIGLQEVNLTGYLLPPAIPAPIERIDSIFHPPRVA